MGVFEAFFMRVRTSFNPTQYHDLADEPLRPTLLHVPLMVLLGFLIWLILAVPTILSITDTVESQLATFTKFELGGTVDAADSVGIPLTNPKFVVDVTQERKIEDESVLITKQYIYLNLIGGAKRIPITKVTHPLDYRSEFAQFMFLVFMLLLPSLLFYGYLGFLLKYTLIIGATIFVALFAIKVLFVIDIHPRRIFNIAVYSATPMVLLDTLVAPLKASLLVPLFDIFGITFYGLSIGVYFGLFIAGLMLVERGGKPSEGRWSF